MLQVVNDTTPYGKPLGCIFSNAATHRATRYCDMAKQPVHRVTNIRAWRQKRELSLDQLAEKAGVDKGNLSKVERGLLPYNQELLERLAAALMTDPASLLTRDPADSAAIWLLWDRASSTERRRIEGVAAALIDEAKSG